MLQLFTDTSANLPVALTKQHHITVVPFSYTVDGKETDYPDDVDFDGAAFYGAMRRGAVVKTSMVNPDLMATTLSVRSLRATMCSTSACPAASAARRRPRLSPRAS